MLVDMPGYGYAARGHAARDAWAPMIEGYLRDRENLKGVVMVMDVCRPWREDESNLVEWLLNFDRPVVLALNKVDKLNQKERAAKEREFAAMQDVSAVVYVSAYRRQGIDDLLRTVFEKLLRS